MKTHLISAFCLLFVSIQINAQHTITSTSKPVLGDVFTSYFADTNNVNPGSGGASKVWDFSGLQISQNKYIVKYILPSATSYGSDFTSSDLASETNYPIKNFVYMSTSANNIIVDGTADTLYQTKYTLNQQNFMNYPFSYDSVISDTYAGTFSVAGNNFVRNGTWNIKGDGYGDLKLPSGTYTNVLRVHSVQANNDGFFTTTITRDEWYSSISKFPLIMITKEIRSGGASSAQRYVTVNSDVVGIREIEENPMQVSVYPNPITEHGTIVFTLKSRASIDLKIYDIAGREVTRTSEINFEKGTHSMTFNFNELRSGAYLLVLSNSKTKERSKIKIIK